MGDLPEKADSSEKVRRYLLGRGISSQLIDHLLAVGLLYQDINNNCVFINRSKNYAEIRASNDKKTKTGKPYRFTWENGGFCWHMVLGKNPKVGYICESCIDAMSLAQICKEDAYYFSVGGAGQYKRIEKVLDLPLETWLAVNNHQSGDYCKEHFGGYLRELDEEYKTWNDALCNRSRIVAGNVSLFEFADS